MALVIPTCLARIFLLINVSVVQVVHSWPITTLRDSSSSSSSPSSWQRRRHLNMAVAGMESTPNPSSFLLRLSEPLEGLEEIGNLRGKTFSAKRAMSAPASVAAVLQIDGVESVYAMSEIVTVSKHPVAKWEEVLPRVVEALGGANDDNTLLLGLLTAESASSSNNAGQVQIRMQVSNKLPIQIEAIGFLGTKQRAKLPSRFAESMSQMMTAKDNDFFASRKWMDRGTRYPDLDVLQEEEITSAERERLEMEEAINKELEEVDAAYPPHRLASIVDAGLGREQSSSPSAVPPRTISSNDVNVEELDLEAVDHLCDEAEEETEAGLDALKTLAAFVVGRKGMVAARRNALAYLGGTEGRGGDVVFDAVRASLLKERSPAMRRTAGDAMSDLGDARAVPHAITALIEDRSKLVRWRAARVLGELADTPDVMAVLRQSSIDEEAFEVAFEIKDALRKVESRVKGSDAAPKTGPVWKQIQEGSANKQ